MSKELRIGLIGCGNISMSAHLGNYQGIENVKVVALCDIRPERFDVAKEKYACVADARTTTDYHDILNSDDIDAVDICTPNYLHAKIAIDALNAGKHVITEKPDGMTADEVIAMKEAADRNGKVLMAMRNNRFTPAAQIAKRDFDKGEYGEFYAAKCGWTRRRGIPGSGTWFCDKELSGGGPLIDLGVHMIDLAIYLMGNPKPVTVSGSTYQKIADPADFTVEDLAMGFIRFDNGSCLFLEFSWASNIDDGLRYVELMGTKKGIKIAEDQLTVHYTTEEGDVNERPDCHGKYGHHAALEHFRDVVLYGEKPIFTPDQGIDMLRILNAIYESARLGREIEL